MKSLLLLQAILLLSTAAVNYYSSVDSPVMESAGYKGDFVIADHNIPVYPGSKIIKESSSDGNYNLVLETTDQPEEVAFYYKKEMQKLGWPDG
ncbi:MAG: hypothetical protein RQ737_12565, partial [Bacteroidales bacterium]|nr:hypothetical protein [Bacteroidales bacterium]